MEFENIQEIFNKPFDKGEWKKVLKNLFANFDEYRTNINRREPNLSYHERAEEINEFGSILLADNKVIKLYDVVLKGDYDVAKNRVGLRNMIFRDIVPGDMDGILAVYRSENGKTWRLTFISKAIYWDDDFNEQKLQTSPRRYTYVLGEDESVKTAAKQFESLFNKKVTIKQLIEAFNVDKLNKRFFSDYQKHYEKFVLELTGEVWKKKQNKYVLTKIQEPSPLLKTAFYNNKKHARDFCKKLLGRIVFLHFLQKKGWMGCAIDDKHWENGEKQFMLELFNGFEDKNHFHSKCLTELFFNTLNKPNRNDIFEVEGLSNHLNGSKVPYLNGGLFETDTNCDPYKVDFPPVFFDELLDFFGQYNFTIDENSPDDHEVGIDPEMLGHIFENLLEENKEKGAFYTPKEIVQYMTQESLIQYLQTHLGEHDELSNFIRNNDIGDRTAKRNYIRDNAAQIEELLDNVKICDPAIGSGAFPMGMLNEIFEAKMALDMTLNRSEVKKKIIQNSIYGVDLESGAVDIARLRFWLALVVDEDEPHALPNLDYKIMQGNSLLESFEGIDLSEIHKGKAITIDDENSGDNLFSKVMEVQEVYNEEKLEDLIKTYFDLDNPVEKKKQHDKIDKQILGKIYKCLFDEHEELESELKKLNRKIKNKSASLSTAEQKIKYESTSKDAKNAKKLRDQIDNIAQKQLKLKELYESDDRPFFLWHLMFQDVFENGGFDIVIGNPPYVQIQKMNDTGFKDSVSFYETFSKSGDVYCLFYEIAIRLLKNEGVLSYITSNSWLKTKYGKLLRKYLVEKFDTNLLVNFEDTQIFPTATVEVNILMGAKKKWGESVIIANITDSINKPLNDKINEVGYPVSNLDLEGWIILNQKDHILKDKIVENTLSIKELDLTIRIGLINGYNDAFIIDTEKKDEISKNCENCSEIIKPVLFGKNLSKYKFNWDNKWIINTHNGLKDPKVQRIDVTNDFPTIYQHLKTYEDKLIIRKNKGDHWTNLRNCAYWKEFEQPKILWGELSDKPKFVYDDQGFYPDATLFSMTGTNLKSLLGILNSKLALWFFQSITTTSGMGTSRWKKYKIEQLPIAKKYDTVLINEVVNYIIYAKESIYTNVFEEIIDALVLELYFPIEFNKSNIEIFNHVKSEFNSIENLTESGRDELIGATYKRISEKKNPLRNQIKLMKLELKQLLLPILSV
jgi:peptide methionine sulfoxide reductase MsrA